jgi:SAM-dependent methyltransferase
MNDMNRNLTIWALFEVIILIFWIYLGLSIKKSAIYLLLFLIIGIYLIFDFYNQLLISWAVKALREQIEKGNLSEKEIDRNLKKIHQVEVKRSYFTALPYFFRRTGLKRVPNYSTKKNEELLDFAPYPIKDHVLNMMAKLSWWPFRNFLAPLKKIITRTVEKDGVFVGLEPGCGYAQLLEKLAKWCHKKELPVVLIGLDNQAKIIKKALERIRKKFEVLYSESEEKVDVESLINKAKEKKAPVIYLLRGDANNLDSLFEPSSIVLTQIVHAKHHFESEEVMTSVKKISKHWIIMEESRSWMLLSLLFTFYWCVSRLLTCDGEDSILAMHTPEEWKAQGINVASKWPFFVWAMSDSLGPLFKD